MTTNTTTETVTFILQTERWFRIIKREKAGNGTTKVTAKCLKCKDTARGLIHVASNFKRHLQKVSFEAYSDRH